MKFYIKLYFVYLIGVNYYFTDGEHEFLDLNEKLSKLAKFAPHLWKDDVSRLPEYQWSIVDSCVIALVQIFINKRTIFYLIAKLVMVSKVVYLENVS